MENIISIGAAVSTPLGLLGLIAALCYYAYERRGRTADKNELLFEHGTNFNDLPLWQRRGVGLYWEDYDRPAENPVTGEKIIARRRRIRRDLELPMKDDYSAFLRKLTAESDRSVHS